MAKIAAEQGVNLSTIPETEAAARLSGILARARTPIRLHGTRVEEMFVYATAAIGAVRAIKREETEDLVTTGVAPLAVPDFRVVLEDGSEMLVEVKNVHERHPMKARAPKLTYLERLAAYGDLFSRPVYLAVYWSAWRRWTLHRITDLLDQSAGDVGFSFGEAFRRSEMHLLGDVLLGTRYPLSIRFGVTSTVLKRGARRSKQLVRIDNVTLTVAGREIRNKRDESIAAGLMFHGGWEEKESLTMDGDRVVAIEYSYSPRDTSNPNDFAPVAALSSLASAQFNDLTARDATIERLRPRELPSPPYPRASEGYYGVDLPIWILILRSDTTWASAKV